MCMLYCSDDTARTHSHRRDFGLERQIVVTRSCVKKKKSNQKTDREREKEMCAFD